MDFAENAKASAQIYFEYLKTMNKGEINYEVISKVPTVYRDADGYFALKLRGPRITQPEFLQIKIDNKVYDSFSIEIATYIEQSNTLVIKPAGDIYEKVKSVKYYQIKIFTDLKFLVKRVEDWYDEYGSLVMIPVTYPSITLDRDSHLVEGASETQIEAMEGVLSSPFTYVWGAPGTGKTQFVLARLVGMYVEAGKKVLIVAPTNNAVEQTLKGVLPVLKSAGIEIEDVVLRLGVPSDRFVKEFPEICESSRRARAIRKIQEQMSHVKEEISKNNELLKLYSIHKERLTELREIEEYLSFVENKHTFLDICTYELKTISDTVELQLTQLQNLEAQERQLENSIEKNRVELGGLYVARDNCKNGLKAIFMKKKLDLIEQAIEASLELGTKFNKEIDFLKTQIGALQIEIANNNESVKSLTSDARILLTEIKDECAIHGNINEIVRQISIFNYQEKSELLLEKLRSTVESKRIEVGNFDMKKSEENIEADNESLNCKLESLYLQYKEVSSDVDERIEKCQIIAATIDTCLARVTPNMSVHFDHIFLDEAGYSCTIKAATLLAFDSPVTFLGDHMQLPPVCEMDDDKFQEKEYECVSFWAQSALHVENAINGLLEDFVEQYLLAEEAPFYLLKKFSLKQTFRFGPKLAAVLADDVYDSSFIGNENHDTNIYSIDACKGQNDEKRTSSGEVYAIIEYLRTHPEEEIAILTPYKKQVNLIKQELNKNRLDENCVYTIHGSQGREWETVLLSVVDTHDMWFVDSYNKKGRGKNLINTAVSRAKKKLVIVADKKYWLNREGQLIEKLISVSEAIK